VCVKSLIRRTKKLMSNLKDESSSKVLGYALNMLKFVGHYKKIELSRGLLENSQGDPKKTFYFVLL